MLRAIIELCITILIAYVARAVLASLMRGITNASSHAFQEARSAQPNTAPPGPQPASAPPSGSELHKDPVCGTYVSESTPFRRKRNGGTVYYCSST
ncbi:MAG: hypothetical protein ACRD4O_19795, partial [Bryobacteraceae bacterium]